MMTIALNKVWSLGTQLDRGGFGKVFEAVSDDGSPAAVKLVPMAPGGDRELLFEQLSGLPNIVPVLDSGEWEDYYVLVMPRAVKSLRRHLEEAGGKLSVDESVPVFLDIAEALSSLTVGVVHRDLKPENVLYYQGHWCLADFGIARYAEATTAPDTHKYAMTPPYAAPEQWRGERATNATDVYAFGVVAFEVLQGQCPFSGPDFRDQHLNQPPPRVTDCPPSLSSLISECLFKAHAARPTAANILARLRASQKTAPPAAAKLQAANRVVIERQSVEAAQKSAQRSRAEARRELFAVARQSLQRIQDVLLERILEAAPATRVSSSNEGLTLGLGNGALRVDKVEMAPADCLAAFDYEPPFDVIAYSGIAARKPRDRFGYEGRSHSLWFCDAHEEGVYRWYELAFMVLPSVPERYALDPFALPPTDQHAARALAPVMDVRQLAWQPVAFDQGSEDPFVERWLGWFASAADGSLSHPSNMPENSGGEYRLPRQHTR